MIHFTCHACGKAFKLPDHLAGRKGKCRACGAGIVVPRELHPESSHSPSHTPAPVPSSTRPEFPPAIAETVVPPTSEAPSGSRAKIPMRTRRLLADAEQMRKAFASFSLVRVIDAVGDPPERYRVEYTVRGLEKTNGKPVVRSTHIAEFQLTSEYPRQSPKCRMLTPIFHPNIDPATICVGDHWAAGERLVDLVIRVGEMIAYQAYNIKSPLDAEAAMWADLHADELPVDTRSLRPSEE